jgi:YD repeat-containing protein
LRQLIPSSLLTDAWFMKDRTSRIRFLRVLVGIVVICAEPVAGQTRKLDVEHDGFKGKVRTVLTETAKLKEKKGKVAESHRGFASIWRYDVQGNLVEEQTTGSLRQYRYDNGGNRYEKRASRGMSGGPPTAADFKFQQGKAADGSRLFKWVSKYDSAGNRIEETVFSGVREYHARFVYKYDDKGRRVDVTYEAQGSPTKRFVYSYDDTGRLRQKLEYQGKEPAPLRRSQDFEFDSAGNWVKSTTQVRRKRGGKDYFESAEVVYRTITYY